MSFPFLLGLLLGCPSSIALVLLAAVNSWVGDKVLFEFLRSLLEQLFQHKSVLVKVELVWSVLALGEAQGSQELSSTAI